MTVSSYNHRILVSFFKSSGNFWEVILCANEVKSHKAGRSLLVSCALHHGDTLHALSFRPECFVGILSEKNRFPLGNFAKNLGYFCFLQRVVNTRNKI